MNAPSGATGSPVGRRAITTCSAGGLRRRGPGFVRPLGERWSAEDRVALIGDLTVDGLGALLAIRERGLCPVPIEPSFTLEEMAFAINDSQARQVLIDPSRMSYVDQLRPLTPYVEAWTELSSGPAPALQEDFALLGLPCGTLHYSAAQTGRPVGYAVPDAQFEDAGRRDLDALLGDRSIRADDRILLATSLSDPAAVQLAVAAYEANAELVLAGGAPVADLIAAISAHRPNLVHLSPATALALVKALDAGAAPEWTPRLVLITAPWCPPSVTRGLVEVWGPVVRIVYLGPGVGAIAAIEGVDVLLYPGSVGVPLDDLDAPRIRIVADGSGSGLIEAEHPVRSGSWVSWGDRGIISRGRLTVVDQHHAGVGGERRARMPQAVEGALVAHPWVADAALVAGRDGDHGRTMVYVQATPVADLARLEAVLIETLNDSLPIGWVPERIAIVPALPRTGSGKLDRRRLLSLDPFEGRDAV